MRVALLVVMTAVLAHAVELYSTLPAVIHPEERYVFYLHGLIVEGVDPKPVSPEFGVYDFPAITAALFEEGGFNLIAQQRPKNADIATYVGMLESWVHKLMDAGVPASRITLVGFSRGSHITAGASSRLRDSGIHTALLGSCINGDIPDSAVPNNGVPLVLGGDLLSIYETSDSVLSCDVLARRSKLASFREIAISTGRKHGAFFQPLPTWMTLLKAWIKETNR